MGIGQWTRTTITSGSIFCIQYNIKPGEYLIMYDTSTSKIIIKDQKQKIVYEKYANSFEDLVAILSESVPEPKKRKIIEGMKKGGKSGSKSFHNHHIIPFHLWEDCNLIINAKEYGVIDMNGPDNLMPMPYEIHSKCHDKNSPYSQTVRRHLRDRWNALVEADLENDPQEIRDQLISLIHALRANLEDIIEEGGYMNDI